METQNSRKARPDSASASHKICCAWDPQACDKSGASDRAQQKGQLGIYLGSWPVGLKFPCHAMVRSKYRYQDFATASLDAIQDLVVAFEY